MLRFRFILATLVIGTASITYAAAQQSVGQKGRLFKPGMVTLKAGGSLSFHNDDDVTHHVYSSSKGQEFDLDTMDPKDTETHTFAKRGRVDVRCGLHPGMRLVINVE